MGSQTNVITLKRDANIELPSLKLISGALPVMRIKHFGSKYRLPSPLVSASCAACRLSA